jgi:F5/8 type C domain
MFACCFIYPLAAQQRNTGKVQILYTPDHPCNQFIPSKSLGGAFDGHEKGDMDRMLSAESLQAMQTVGLKPVSYRLRTELGGEVWHWNPKGTWSEAGKQQGYWVSDSVSTGPIQVSYGYRLPRRGNTIDQANDDGYSRIADGNKTTFWKSNPYLDEYYTKESNELHPQWVVIDLGELKNVNTIRIHWGNPFALVYQLEYALNIGSDYFEPFQPNLWHPFPKNVFNNPKGENGFIRVTEKPLKVRFVRISMTKSSYTTTDASEDIRDKLGFAIKEMEIGLQDRQGKFHDWVHHAPRHQKQSVVYVSSTDPWHRVQDIDPNVEQAGIDRFFTCGLTAGQPAMMPGGLLYDTPENVVALVSYLKAKPYPFEELEMGEEPEGQLISPVDYAALYDQFGTKVKDIKPDVLMGGPGFATLSFTKDDEETFSEAKWTKLFLGYLKKHNAINLFNFFTFEWYPFDDVCAPTAPQLAIAPQMLSIALENFQHDILPVNTPIYLSEYGYSAFGGKAEVEIEGALMYADIVGKFLQLGGSKSFLYGYEPAYLEQTNGCDFGNNILFGLGNDGKIKYHTAAYYGVQMLTQDWAQPADSVLEIYPATCDIVSRDNLPLVAAYALHGSNDKWSVLLINKDPKKTWSVDVDIMNTVSKNVVVFHPTRSVQYSKQQYHWMNNGSKGHPSLCLPPVTRKLDGLAKLTLPPYSLTILN